MNLPQKQVSEVDKTAIFHNQEDLIIALADLAGFNVFEIRGEGFVIEPVDEELNEFLNGELAAEKYEAEISAEMGYFLGDD